MNKFWYDNVYMEESKENAPFKTLKFGESDSKDSIGGGIIEIISSKSIINYGQISVDGVGDGAKGGTISFKCDKFINYGEISAVGDGGNGQIQICFSSEYKNENVINPEPNMHKEEQ